jgi:hypothetical protein
VSVEAMSRLINDMRCAVVVLAIFASTLAMAQNIDAHPVVGAEPQTKAIEGVNLRVQRDVTDLAGEQSSKQVAKPSTASDVSLWRPRNQAADSLQKGRGEEENLLGSQTEKIQSNPDLSRELRLAEPLPTNEVNKSFRAGDGFARHNSGSEVGSSFPADVSIGIARPGQPLGFHYGSAQSGAMNGTGTAFMRSNDPSRVRYSHLRSHGSESNELFGAEQNENNGTPFFAKRKRIMRRKWNRSALPTVRRKKSFIMESQRGSGEYGRDHSFSLSGSGPR